MLVDTTRFGPVEVDETRIIRFADGLLGFPNHHRFALLQAGGDSEFFCLQSVDDPALALNVCDPRTFVPHYAPQLDAGELTSLQMHDKDDAQLLAVVSEAEGRYIANLLGPLVIGADSLLARQVVLADRHYTTQHTLERR
jgi:flagellar assembly factor FliW